MLNATTIAQLNRALENSFSNIKRDINEIKFLVTSQSERYADVKRGLEEVRGDSASKDKLNVLKIKIGELNDSLKKVWDLEKQLKAMGGSKTLQEAIDELHARMIALDVKVNDVRKTSASEEQLKTVIAQINNEMNKLSSDLRDAEKRRDEVRRDDILAHTQKIVKRIDATNHDIAELRKSMRNYVSENEVRGVLNEINKEFDVVANELDSLRKQSKDFVNVAKVKGMLDGLKDFASKKDVEELRKEVKRVDYDKLSRGEFSDVVSQIDKELEKLGEPKEPVDSSYGASVVFDSKKSSKKMIVAKTEKPVVSHRKKYLFGNFLIFLAFLSLVGSIGAYYFNQQMWMDRFAIGAVIVFVLGMILRVYSVLKSQ